MNINRTWESIRQKIKVLFTENLGYYEMKEHKPWLDDESSKLLDQRKRAKL